MEANGSSGENVQMCHLAGKASGWSFWTIWRKMFCGDSLLQIFKEEPWSYLCRRLCQGIWMFWISLDVFFSIFLVLNKDDFQASPRHAAEPWSSSGTAFWGHHPSGRTAHVDFSGVDTLAAWARVSGLPLCYGEILTTRSYKDHDDHAGWTTIAKSCCWWVIFKRNLFVITFTWPDLIDA